MGGLLFGKYVDAEEIAQLAQIMNLDFSLEPESAFKLNAGSSEIVEGLQHSDVVVRAENSDIVSGYTMIEDVNSVPLFVLSVTQDRTVYQQGVIVGEVFQLAAILFSFCIGALLYFLLEREIVKPMTRLASYVEEISLDTTAPEPKVLMHSTEELAVLTDAVKNTLKRKFEGMSEVSRMVGHDLRNPLTGIRGASYLLRKKHLSKDDQGGLGLLKTIDDCVAYSDKIVSDLLEYSCEMKLDKAKYSLGVLVNNSLSTFMVPNNIQVVNDLEGEYFLLVDASKIERVFNNLIKNAFDAMPNGGTLRISCKKADDMVEVDFADNGVGMSKEVIEKLWLPFFTTKAKGMGVGLPISKRIVEAHDGRIEVYSKKGKGTCFAVFLPLAKSLSWL